MTPTVLSGFDAELNDFKTMSYTLPWAEGEKVTFGNFMATVNAWDPLKFWSLETVQSKFPTFLQYNTLLLGSSTTSYNTLLLGSPTKSIFLESMFSLAGHTLDDRRRKLLQNSPYLEA